MKTIEWLYQDSINHDEVSYILLELLANEYIANHKITEYVSDINLRKRMNRAGEYCLSNHKINMNVEGIIKRTNNIVEAYTSCFMTLYHELTHAKQQKMMCSDNIPKYELKVLQDSDIMQESLGVDFYHQNHDLFPMEHNAEAEAAKELINLVDKLKINYNLAFRMYAEYLKKNYVITHAGHIEAPTVTLYKKALLEDSKLSLDDLSKEDLQVINQEVDKYIEVPSNLSLYNRLKYGLPLTSEQEEIVFNPKHSLELVKTL